MYIMSTRLTQFIQDNGTEVLLNKNEVFQSSDQSPKLACLKKGYIKRYLIKADGAKSTQSIYGPGYVFPLTHAYKLLLNIELSNSNEPYYYESITPASVYAVEDKVLVNELTADPLLYKDLFIVSGERLKSNIQQLECSSLHGAYNQLAYELYCLAKLYGKDTKKGTKLLVPVTHQDLADILDSSRETVSVNISKLKQLGIIENDKHYVVTDMERLLEEAGI